MKTNVFFKNKGPVKLEKIITVCSSISFPKNTSLNIFDIKGNLIDAITSQLMDAGNHTFEWNAVNYSSGVYFVKLNAGNYSKTEKLILMK